MKYVLIAISLLATYLLKAQENLPDNKLPVFKQVTHPFMPPITSEYFFFSEDGLIWFSTAQGLTSFDGSEVTYFSSLQQSNNFGLNRIATMVEDKGHNFYLGTAIGLIYYDRKTRSFTNIAYTFSDSHKQSDLLISALYCDREGLVYAGSVFNGMLVYDPSAKRLQHFNIDPRKPDSWSSRAMNTVSSLVEDMKDKNTLWVGSFHGIYFFDKKNKTFQQRFEIINPGHYPGLTLPEYCDIQKMDVENDSTIWFNSWTGGFGRYNTYTGKAKLFLHDARLKSDRQYIGYVIPKFARISPGKYLLGIYDYKSAVFDCKTETVQYFNVTNNNDEREQTRYVTNDRQGNVWLMQRGLLYVAIPENIQLQTVKIPDPNRIHSSQLRDIYFDKITKCYYGSFLYANGVHVFDTNFHMVRTIPVPILNNIYTHYTGIANHITMDGTGRLWTSGIENYVLPSGAPRFLPLGKVYPSLGWIKSENGYGDVETTKYGDVLFKDENGNIFRIGYKTLNVDSIRPPEIRSEGGEIKASSQWYDATENYIYFIRSAGIGRYNLENKQTTVIPRNSLFGNLPQNSGVCQFAIGNDGHIWFMIPKYGFRSINPKTLACEDSIPFGTRGLIRGDYTTIIGAERPYLLLRSQNGVVIYDYLKHKSFLFDRDNGLSSPDNEALLYCNGYLLVGEFGSIEYFKVSNLNKELLPLVPRLNSIFADSSVVYLNSGNDSSINIRLPHYQNSLIFSFSAKEFFFPERIEYAYQLSPFDKGWHFANYFNRKINFTRLAPGKYIFRLKAQMQGGNWTAGPKEYIFIISPAWWQTLFFKILVGLLLIATIIYFYRKRISQIRKKASEKSQHEKELLELEAKALRAQMNPHFIFNCLNSIKSLIQQNETEKSVTYLTTFSKLIRTLFNNADKKEISLFDELETCKLYMQLEAMRFDEKFSFAVNIDDTIDLKSIQVPALIIQPFIENAIWHGIIPRKNGGHVLLNVVKKDGIVEIVVEDDGIGRESAQQNKSSSTMVHQSKGVNLTQSRLELNNLLQQRQAAMEIIDKKDGDGITNGTKVIITIKEEQS